MALDRRPALAWALLGLIWGATWTFIKIGLEDLPPFTFAAIRFFIAAAPLLALMRVRQTPLPRQARDWWLIASAAVLSIFAGYGLVFWGEKHIPSGLTAVLFTTFPLFGLLFAHYLLPGEPMTPRRLGGVVLGIAGVAIIFGDQLAADSPMALWGGIAIVTSAACGALSGVLIKAYGHHLDPAALTATQMLIGAPLLLAVGVALEGNPLALHWTPLALISLAYLAFAGSSLAFVIWYWLIKRIEVTKAQLLPLLNTLVAVGLGWLVLDEELGWRTLAGGAAILAGMVVTLSSPPAPGPESAAVP
ncbi:MAG: DMT family transporter [Acidobacteriota bacterium]